MFYIYPIYVEWVLTFDFQIAAPLFNTDLEKEYPALNFDMQNAKVDISNSLIDNRISITFMSYISW